MKLFGPIRRKLIGEGRLRKYLLYAIGEILLVMIGILLAFQVDKWNQNRLNLRSERQYYENIKGQLQEDRGLIVGNIAYNTGFLEQFSYAHEIQEQGNRELIDTLTTISIELIRYSDLHRKSNVYESIVHSGQIRLLRNQEIIEQLQRLEETYVYINKLEETHVDAIKNYVIPQLAENIKISQAKAMQPDVLYDFRFQNIFTLFIGLMHEKNAVYEQALVEIDGIIDLIDQEVVLAESAAE